jgi:hypothetical protein
LAEEPLFLTVPSNAKLTLDDVWPGCHDRDSGGNEGYAIREFTIARPQADWRGHVVAAFEDAAEGLDWKVDRDSDSLVAFERPDGARIEIIHLAHRPEGEFFVVAKLPPGTFCG